MGTDAEPLDIHWWALVRQCPAIPFALFGLGVGIEGGGAAGLFRSLDVSPIVRTVAGLVALSVPACGLVFVVAASRDKRLLDERTGDAGARVRAFTRDGTERFTRRFEAHVGSLAVAPAARYVGAVARTPSAAGRLRRRDGRSAGRPAATGSACRIHAPPTRR
ncbi:hypothetical protein [Salinigranum marinum]|uniref:hypothetical protein n=1 Tax=Salinigranum marinum TaxID=1515595 RepID=UPI002989BB6F|nr:hypothetical protein [Salinigranum marinum]